jgi:hypothetical protein
LSEHVPILLIELLLVGGGVGLFAWWQFRDLAKEREKTRRRREQTPEDGNPP